MQKSFISQNPSVLVFLAFLAVFTIAVTVMSEAFGVAFLSTSVAAIVLDCCSANTEKLLSTPSIK